MIDGHRQWHKACYGFPASETDRRQTFCQYTIQGNGPLIVTDAHKDARFADNPFVTGEPHIRSYAGVPLRTSDGHNVGTLCAIGTEPREFSANETEILSTLAGMAMEELEPRQTATTDGLTRVLSRSRFKQQSQRAVALAILHKHSVACIVFDLDHFKSINDRYGHAGGDEVLIEVAGACNSLIRKTDLIGRLGGEEFAMLLPYTDRREALKVAEKVRARIENLSFHFRGERLKTTASFGVAALTDRVRDIDTLLADADAALYQAKAAGRNTCVSSPAEKLPEKSVRRRVLVFPRD